MLGPHLILPAIAMIPDQIRVLVRERRAPELALPKALWHLTRAGRAVLAPAVRNRPRERAVRHAHEERAAVQHQQVDQSLLVPRQGVELGQVGPGEDVALGDHGDGRGQRLDLAREGLDRGQVAGGDVDQRQRGKVRGGPDAREVVGHLVFVAEPVGQDVVRRPEVDAEERVGCRRGGAGEGVKRELVTRG